MTLPTYALDWRAAGLTSREREVAALVACGLRNRDIAEQLVISEKTAKNHVQRVLEKLGARSRAEVAAHARELGLSDAVFTSAPYGIGLGATRNYCRKEEIALQRDGGMDNLQLNGCRWLD